MTTVKNYMRNVENKRKTSYLFTKYDMIIELTRIEKIEILIAFFNKRKKTYNNILINFPNKLIIII